MKGDKTVNCNGTSKITCVEQLFQDPCLRREQRTVSQGRQDVKKDF